MKGLTWEVFQQQASQSICKQCSCGSSVPWRGNAACLQAWLRFHSSRGIILACHASGVVEAQRRLEDTLMSEHRRS